MGPRDARSTVLAPLREALCVLYRHVGRACRRIIAFMSSEPDSAFFALHNALLVKLYEISRLPELESSKPRKKFKDYPIGYFHTVICKVGTGEGRL